ncbi:hypothetical protein SAMN05444266_108181 [Chitinophaga jiangningensis]|uniref:Uncharacterized protein n=1 Tax=Chitinophaga jiangningensis TaxID=1419482 RepID=A0A1M7J1H1_9BACT|nr:hypothetical protein [Chitinophaga jiangningensis]SHM46775.1 hypothetical protein SAMN05444266_108181 [Chitinophaga jiangningensis]
MAIDLYEQPEQWAPTIITVPEQPIMINKTDEFINNRLIWKAKKYGLPQEFSLFYNDLTDEQVAYLSNYFNPDKAGIPVLFFTSPGKEWTLVCTRQIIGFDLHSHYTVCLKEVKTMFPYAEREINDPLQRGRAYWKKASQQLEVKTKHDVSLLFHAANPTEVCTLWNLLIMAVGFNQEDW